jgi:Protein of unknown function (DUF4238)
MPETKNQHYLPRFLLNRFASRSKGEEYFTWCFHKGRNPYEPNTKGIAAERFFYGKSTETSIEAELGIREDDYSTLLREVSSTGNIKADQALKLAELIANLLIRTRHLRIGFSQSFEHLTRDVIQTALQDPRIKRLISVAANVAFPSNQESTNREKYVLDELHKAINLESHIKKLPDLAKKAQVSALENRHPQRTGQLAGLIWKVDQRQHLILGDIGLIVYDKTRERFKPGTTFDHEGNEYLLLPIDPSTLLVGSTNSDPFKIDDERINVASSTLSEKFFISSTKSIKESYFHDLLGREFEKWSRLYREETSFDWPQDLS